MEYNVSTKPEMRDRWKDIEIDGMTVSKAMQTFAKLCLEYGNDVRIETYADSCLDGAPDIIIRICYKTPETEKEILQRIEGNTNRMENEERIDRMKYESLKKKFGD